MTDQFSDGECLKSQATRRSFLSVLALAVPALTLATPAKAWTQTSAQDVGLVPATGAWATLEHVTDGTDPSPAVIAPPHFTSEIRKLAGTEVTLTGYVQPVSGGFGGARDYLLSRNSFHCVYCYAFGRGSLVLATFNEHIPLPSTRRVTVRGQLALQEKDPADFYYQLKHVSVVS